MGMSANLCARHPRRSGALNGAVALTDGVGKMIGPALAAPIFAAAISSSSPHAGGGPHASPEVDVGAQGSTPLFFFCALGGLFVALGAAGALLPTSVDGVDRTTTTSSSEAFRRLEEE